MALNCFRYLGYTSFDQVDKLTMKEYELLMQAVRLREIDKDYRNHLQAFLNFVVKAEKQSGNRIRPVFTKFKQFYDYKKELDKATKKKSTDSRFAGIGKFFSKGE